MATEGPGSPPLTTLIATKLDHRHDRHATVWRERLRDQLQLLLSDQYRVAAVEAPAGYGKTTILSQWRAQLAEQNVASGWLTLESADDDPARFLTYLAAALSSILPNFDIRSTSAFLSSGLVGIDPMLAELGKSMGEDDRPFVLFLDDYHYINSRDVHDAVSRLIREAPPNMAFVIAGRFRSPLPFAQLKVNNQLIEISAEDLSFRDSEAREFLREIKGIGIDDGQVRVLRARAEGWIAGLQLAALALKTTSNTKQFIEDFSGSDRDITDYLGEMVLDRQSAEMRDFLLRTSVLTRMNASLCVELTGNIESQALLERIEAENLFLLPLDRERKWYRYHQLFSDFLYSRLRKSNAEIVPYLFRTASQWSRRQRYDTEAVDYAFQAQDVGLAADIIAEAAPDLAHRRGEMHTVLEWVRKLPPDVVENLPRRADRKRLEPDLLPPLERCR